MARALDGEGREAARAHQWVNLPRRPAEVEVMLETGREGRPVAARLVWDSLTGERPTAVRLAVDGRPLAVDAKGRALLPQLDPLAAHVLSVELDFASEGTARRDVAFGGDWGASVSSQLTAVPVRLAERREPSPEELAAALSAGGRPARVVAVESGPAQVLLVRALAAREASQKLGGRRRGAGVGATTTGPVPSLNSADDYQSALRYADDLRHEMKLGPEDRLRFLWPTARSAAAATLPTELFAASQEFTAEDGGLHWLLTQVYHPLEVATGQRFADAAAVAGLQAAAGNRRRAVVVVLGGDCADASRYSPAAVRGYLAAIRVPLYVWSLAKPRDCPALAAWGEVEDISGLPLLRRAAKRLREELEAQRIVWIEGQHPPQAIRVAGGRGVVEVAGGG